ncbi:MAG TPA: hypothetical protein VFW71_03690 [Actinomycetota bacterium]|nr:hypothetical protein [Actinomycetota bacterium]
MSLYQHVPHPHTTRRRADGPTKVADQAQGFNGKLAVKITAVVGTMVCAYLFTALALISLPGALKSGDAVIIVAWIAQTFIQLVLLPIIIVGQNIQAKASDKRAEETYLDAEAVLHEAQQIQAHLAAQDAAIEAIAAQAGVALATAGGVPPAGGATA